MTINISPPPPPTQKFDSNGWQNFFLQLYRQAATTTTVTWSNIDFSGSNITSIATRLHNTLQGIQGGASGDQQHLLQSQVDAFTGNAVGTKTTIAVTSGSQNITATTLQSRILLLTGTLTANATLVFDSSVIGDWIVRNNTTGAFTTTLTVPGGGAPSVVVSQNKSAHVYSIGTGVYSAAAEI